MRPGQVILFSADFSSRESLLVSLGLRSRWTHAALVVDGDTGKEPPRLLNTYPATDAVLLHPGELLTGREYVVLDLPERTQIWRARVRRAALSLLGKEYWASPCSRVVAQAFLLAGVDLFGSRELSLRERLAWVTPEELLTCTRLVVRDIHLKKPYEIV